MKPGQSKLQMYYVGPKDRPIMRTIPYSEQAQTFDKLYGGHNVLTVNEAGKALPGIKPENATGAGVTGLERSLARSRFGDISNLKMPAPGTTSIAHVTVQRDGKPESLLVALYPLEPMNLWQPNAGIAAERLMLGFVVPDREIYASLYGAQAQIDSATSRIVKGILASVLAFLVLVLAVAVAVSRRFTAGLVALADAAGRLTRANDNIQAPVKGRDEVALVGAAFNSMAREIREYTGTLEQRAADRTREPASATQEIQQLYEKLKDENLRMGAELDVARRIQMMVLPSLSELDGIPDLDIASHVKVRNAVELFIS